MGRQMKKKRSKRQVSKKHRHRTALRGEQRRRAQSVGEPVAFIWECNDPSCLKGHR